MIRLGKNRKKNPIYTEPTDLSTGGISRCREVLGAALLRRSIGSVRLRARRRGGTGTLGIKFKPG